MKRSELICIMACILASGRDPEKIKNAEELVEDAESIAFCCDRRETNFQEMVWPEFAEEKENELEES